MVSLREVGQNFFKIRLFAKESLVFCFVLCACISKNKAKLEIEWKNKQAVGIIIPKNIVNFIPPDSITLALRVSLVNNSTTILGECVVHGDFIVFRPLISLTRGLTYEVKANGKLVDRVKIPLSTEAPRVVAVYPLLDTIPENLLKFYIVFSNPMQEGTALQNISLVKNSRDTIHFAFLDLQQELWNLDRTMLTLWLDPGRIKRDLVPNKTMGPPLEQANSYELIIAKEWNDATATALDAEFRKSFFTVTRDSLPPDPQHWVLHKPEGNSMQALKIEFGEPLDYVLISNTIHIFNADKKAIEGDIQIDKRQSAINFTPALAWAPGKYNIEIESRLEDLAGNNLNHPFDNDLFVKKQTGAKEIVSLSFEIK